jgi:CheY-like chemotaxis protein
MEGMANRPKLSIQVETELLTRCRRKCCLCYALRHDEQPKQGQIAHLDHDPRNNDIDNLVWLCFEHHNEYDSSTRQAKGLTIHEVKAHRRSLYERILLIQSDPIGSATAKIVERYEELLSIKEDGVRSLQAERQQYLAKAEQLQAAVDQTDAELKAARQQLVKVKANNEPQPIVDALGTSAAIRRIVYYDPHTETARVTAALLQRCGYEASSAANMGALRLLLNQVKPFDLLIADPYGDTLVWNTEMCGLMSALHKEGTWGIATSATCDSWEEEQAKQAGFSMFITKPYSIETLLTAIRYLASEKHRHAHNPAYQLFVTRRALPKASM